MAFTLPTLPYDYKALEPYIDAQTMEIHYSKHHQAYVTNFNNAVAGKPESLKRARQFRTQSDLLSGDPFLERHGRHGSNHFGLQLPAWRQRFRSTHRLESGLRLRFINGVPAGTLRGPAGIQSYECHERVLGSVWIPEQQRRRLTEQRN